MKKMENTSGKVQNCCLDRDIFGFNSKGKYDAWIYILGYVKDLFC